jgi:hypothetical protein
MSQWRRLQSNATQTTHTTTHIRCEPDFLNTFGDLTCWIDPSTTLRIVTQNFQGITLITVDDKLQCGIANMISLQSGTPCLTETNVKWRNYSSHQGYKYAFTKLYASSRHNFSSSSEISSSHHKRGGTAISATDRWNHRIYLSGEDSTGAGRWSYFTLLGKDKTMIVISCYRVCPCPPPSNIASSYYQQSRIMESEDESIVIPIDPHCQTIRDMQIFIKGYQQQGYFIFLLMDGNHNYSHIFQPQDIRNRTHTPLGFNYAKNIDGSIDTLAESCNLVNIHKIKHDNVPETHNAGYEQIEFIYILEASAEFTFHCGILDFNSLFYSDHHPLFLDIYILRLLGYPVQGTVKFIEHDLKLNDPRIVRVYQSSLFQKLLNQNIAARVDALYLVNASAWLNYHENNFNQIDRDVERAMNCEANACRRKSYKKHKWTEEYTRGI